MSKFILFLVLIGSGAVLFSCSEDADERSIPSEDLFVDIPDINFKTVLINDAKINTDGDSEISKEEAASFTGIIVGQNSAIESAVGIEYFTEVTRIALFGNSISEINLSNNTKVTQLLIEQNELTSIDISKLELLTDFKAHSNRISTANLANGNNTNMTRMQLQENSDLDCIRVDELAVPRRGWLKDDKSYYDTNCN